MERLKLKVAVYLMLIKDDKILLLRRFNTGWKDGNYSLPSGHLEQEETLIQALLRESEEEVGVKIRKEDTEFVHTMHRKSVYIDFYFTVKEWKGEIQNMEKDKCDDVSWFSLDSLPENIVPGVKFAIQNYQKGIKFSEFESEE
jgi:8-oxo-dGTP diphosphatase